MAKPAQTDIFQANWNARRFILDNSMEMIQQIFSASYTPANQSVVNVVPQNVGLIKGFLVVVDGTLANAGASNAARTQFGAANALSNIQFNDLQNQVRINTAGWHLAFLATAKQGYVFGGAYTVTAPYNFAANWTVQSLASSIASGGGTAALRQIYWVPLAYSADDLRGAIYASVTQANMNLQLTINTSPGYTTGDPTLAIAGGTNTAVTWSGAVTLTVFQVFLDQLPVMNGQVVLPPLDLATIYDIKNTNQTGMVTAQDFPFAFPNLRNYLSAFAVWDNGGVLGVGADVNYWSLLSANTTPIFKYPAHISALYSRCEIMQDWPNGVYYFNFRRRPISTQQFGNMTLNLNANGAIGSGAVVLYGLESFQLVQTIPNAGSLPGG